MLPPRLQARLERVLDRAATARPAAESARWQSFEHRVRTGTGPAAWVGFTSAALPGHPEEGVESLLVETDTDGAVWFTVAARARPAAWYARLGAPVARLVQRRVARRCLDALC